ncbi:MAG: hypothetical protein WCK02_01410 [Bacteroidota bacterium]
MAKKSIPFLIIIICSLIGFSKIGFLIHPLNYDMIDCALPWRHTVAESIRNGFLPSWNPYQNLGYPLQADPQATSWYPILWFFSLFGKYTISTLHAEFIFHNIIAGIGMFFFLKALKMNTVPSLIGAISYQLSGFFVGNAQHFYLLISATWLPFVFTFYYKLYQQRNIKNAILFSVFVFLFFTGGYPGFLIISAYILGAVLVFNIIQISRKKSDYLFLKYNFISLILILILTAPQWVSVYQSLPFINRTGGVTLKQALFCPFSIESTVSFFAPFATVKDFNFLNTDISMANAYFGIVLLLFFIYGTFKKSTIFYSLLKICILLCLLAAFGELTPFRKFLYDYIPLMNMFRFPSIFRLFVVFGMITIAVNEINLLLNENHEKIRKRMLIITVTAIVGLVIGIVFARSQGYLNILTVLSSDLFRNSETSTLIQHFGIQLLFQISILSILLLLLYKYKSISKYIAYCLLVLIIFDLTLASNINAPYTVCSQNLPFSEAKRANELMQSGFNNIHNYKLNETSGGKSIVNFSPYWRNQSNFTKQVSNDGFTSFYMKNYELMIDGFPQIIDSALKNKVLFSPNHLQNENNMQKAIYDSIDIADVAFTKKQIQIDSNCNNQFENIIINPNAITANACINGKSIIVIQQNYYKYWHAYIDNVEMPIFIVNKTLMGLEADSGKHLIELKYKNPTIKWAFYLSSLTLVLLLGVIVFLSIKPNEQ